MEFKTEELELILECLRNKEVKMPEFYNKVITRDQENTIEDRWGDLNVLINKIKQMLENDLLCEMDAEIRDDREDNPFDWIK